MSLEALMKSRSAFTGVITRIRNRFNRVAEEEPYTYDLGLLERQLAALDHTAAACRQVHREISSEGAGSLNPDEEQDTADAFDESVEETCTLLNRLMAMKQAQQTAANVNDDLEDVEESKNADRHKDYTVSIERITKSFEKLRAIVDKSTIHPDHQLRRDVKRLSCRINQLSIKENCDPRPTYIDTTPASAKTKAVQLPKIALPHFNGDLMTWSTFWSQFRAAVDSNADLTNLNKLAYLRDAIQDPETRSLLFSSAEHDGMYDEVVALLHERFDRRREVHATYCEILTSIGQVKSTKAELTQFADTLTRTISGLRHTGQYELDAFLTSVLVSSIAKPLQIEWEVHSQHQKRVPPIEEFVKFVRFRASVLTAIPSVKPHEEKTETHPKKYRAAVHAVSPHSGSGSTGFRYECNLCPGDKHPLFQCVKFNNMTVRQRGEHIRTFKLCYNCLAPGHRTAECRSLARCKTCGGRHHTLVHREVVNTTPAVNAVAASTNAMLSKSPPIPTSLMMTSQVLVKGPGGRTMVARALLDSGASMSLVSSRVAQTLQLPRMSARVSFSGVQDTLVQEARSIVTVDLCPVNESNPVLAVTAAVVPRVTCDLPLQGASYVRSLPHIKPLQLADPTFHLPGKVDLLLGCDVMPDVMLHEAASGPKNSPMAWKTVFGWAVLGKYIPHGHQQSINVASPTVVESTDSILTRFWETEETSSASTALTPEEEAVQSHFANSHKYVDPPGHYQVTLPRKNDIPSLGTSRPQAVQRFLSNERSVQRKGTWAAFQLVIREYIDLGHAEPVPAHALTPTIENYYLPMHGVVKEGSTTTKLRVVFDASAKTTASLSLNDTLLTGPTLYPTLETILLRFRLYLVAVSADISKMYRAVHLDPNDRDLHRFVWREEPTGPLIDYRMTRVTFGVSSSPYLAIRALQQTAADFGHLYPTVSQLVFTSFYVDDLLTGADTPEQAVKIHHDLRALLLKGGFDLRKWRSSSKQTLDSIEPSLREKVPVQDLTDTQSSHPKALGVEWDSTHDTMSTSLTVPAQYASTKRGVISDVARTFDVLGWLAPTIIQMKVLYQKLWELKLGWDEEIPPTHLDQHVEWRNQLPLLADKRHPRCYFAQATKLTTQLHGFCDASQHAYAAVVYIRTTYADHDPTCVLVTAKTRVAPLKQLSIPRLELCGATLLSKLMTNVRIALSIHLHNVHVWCDSTIVLSWLDGNPKRYKTFVGNRIATILTDLPPATWHHVPTHDNPADCASRGVLPRELLTHSLWWNGPPWLLTDPMSMPPQPLLASSGTPELKGVCNVSVPVPPTWIEEKFERYHKLVHVNAWILRFLANIKCSIRHQPIRTDPYLTATEVNQSEHFLFKRAQAQSFSCELSHLNSDKSIKASSPIKSLSPFLDKEGIMRVGGRLSRSHLSYSQVHPVILSSKNHLCRLMFNHKHLCLGHCGPSLLLSATGSKVHILGARRLSRAVCRSCVVCRRATAQTEQQMMGQLPSARVTPSPPFSVCGVDYAGPFLLKKGHTRKPVIVKAYLAVFVCFSTKAAHLEVVSDATTEAFLACLRRFVSRRGLPAHIHSDNGGNFRGADNDLRELYILLEKNTTQSTIQSYLLSQRVQWHFSPERAPHFGGLWEAAVKSAKRHLKRVIGTQRLDFEEFSTISAQVESCLNSRPLLATTSHSTDGIKTLTPGHFLIGREMCAYPELTIQTDPSLHRRWNLCQAITSHFWRRWSQEYLQQLQKLHKWRQPTTNLQVGDIVVIRDDAAFHNQWPMARIIEVFPGKDGLVRVAPLKTATTTLKRPIAKLAVLLRDDQPIATTQPSPSTPST